MTIASKLWAIACAVLLLLSLVFGSLWVYRGAEIEKQDAKIAEQEKTIKSQIKSAEAQAKADKVLRDKQGALQAERDKVKGKLDETLKNQSCADTPLPDDAQRVLEELYGSKGS